MGTVNFDDNNCAVDFEKAVECKIKEVCKREFYENGIKEKALF